MKIFHLVVTATLLFGLGINFFFGPGNFLQLIFSGVTSRASCDQNFPTFNLVGQDGWRLDYVKNSPEFVLNDIESIENVQKCLYSLGDTRFNKMNRCMGIYHATGIGRGKSIDTAIDYLENAAQLGDAWSKKISLYLKIRHHFMNTGKENANKYIKNINEICMGANDIVALRIVADSYFAQGNNEDGDKCVKRLLILGDPYELCMNGKRLYETSNRERYAEQILASWEKSAFMGGFASSYSNLGLLYEQGIGVNQNYLESMRMYNEAEKRGSISGIRNHAYVLERGLLGTVDYAHAQILYQQAANQGDLFSMRKLGYKAPKIGQ